MFGERFLNVVTAPAENEPSGIEAFDGIQVLLARQHPLKCVAPIGDIAYKESSVVVDASGDRCWPNYQRQMEPRVALCDDARLGRPNYPLFTRAITGSLIEIQRMIYVVVIRRQILERPGPKTYTDSRCGRVDFEIVFNVFA